MVLFNYSTKELTAKVVYYGPGLCGKTTNLQYIHTQLSDTVRGKMLSLATKTDRTLFFDFLPMDLGEIRGMKTRMQLYTVPGQVFYNETRKLVLKGVDGLVFVADSQKEMLGANIEAFKNLEENLKCHGLILAELPHILQLNKRDLPKLSSIEEINASVNKYNAPFYESVATTGIGVQDSLKAITKLVLLHLTKKYDPRTAGAEKRSKVTVPAPASVAVAEPAIAAAPAVTASATASAGTTAPVAATEAPVSAATAVAIPPSVELDEIDDLIDEVQESPSVAPTETPEMIAEPETVAGPTVEIAVGGSPAADETVRLTDALTEADLFEDPSLEVARLAAGDVREIVIPVLVDQKGAPEQQRYKLSLKMRLVPVD